MKKFIAFFLALTLTLGVSSAYTEESAPSCSSLKIEDLAIPKELGKIDGRFVGPGQRWIILIQDIHGHLAAQENISAIVDHLSQLYGIDTFGVEGGWSKTKLPRSRRVPNSRSKQQLARALLEEEYITGPFYSALFNDKPLKLIGVENKDLYLKNRGFFMAQMDTRENSLKKISAAETALAELKKQTYNPELSEFDKRLSAFREGHDVESFMPSLVKTAEALGVDLADLEQITLFKEIMALEANLDRETLKSQIKRLIPQNANPRLSFEEILRSGQISEVQLSHYPEVLKFRGILKSGDALSHHAFFEQIETTLTRVKEKLFKSEDEKALDGRSERLGLIKKIVLLQAVPEDIKKSSVQKEAVLEEAAEADLSKELENGVGFYKLAQKRDAAFFEQIKQLPLLAGNIGVVAGGFHTEGLTARLEKSGVSYMIITPSLGDLNEPPDEKLYFQRMRDGAALAPGQTLSHLSNRPFTRLFDLAFVAGIGTLKETNDQRRAVQTVLTFKEPPGAPGGKKGAVTTASFMALDETTQKNTVEAWLEELKQSRLPMVLAARTTTLLELLKDPAALTYWKNWVAPDKLTTVGEMRDSDEYLDALLGMKAAVVRVKTGPADDLGALIARKFQSGEIKKDVALIDGEYKSEKLLVLPKSPASLLLARLLLEEKISGNVTPEFAGRISSLLTEIFTARGILEQSA